ncbi:MAG: hypothetical protein KKG06_12145 [Bacteroidetes bacterium]|nr:hypothetical protein [Bacteroidota bacterium]MBU1423906.1 hypothetical protein [Bacteroidota bacterium]
MVKIILLFILLSTSNIFGQFSFESFLSESFTYTLSSIKSNLADKKIEEKEVMNYKAVMYYDWLDPISIKVGYLFSSEGTQKGKIIANAKKKEEDAVKLFSAAKNFLTKKYGNEFSENSMRGMTFINWKGVEDFSIVLTHKGDKTMVTVLKN